MGKPEKLFPNGPEWEYDDRRYYVCIIGFSVSLESYEWSEPPNGKWKATNGGAWSGWVTLGDALDWARSRIIAHRDELVRVTS